MCQTSEDKNTLKEQKADNEHILTTSIKCSRWRSVLKLLQEYSPTGTTALYLGFTKGPLGEQGLPTNLVSLWLKIIWLLPKVFFPLKTIIWPPQLTFTHLLQGNLEFRQTPKTAAVLQRVVKVWDPTGNEHICTTGHGNSERLAYHLFSIKLSSLGKLDRKDDFVEDTGVEHTNRKGLVTPSFATDWFISS